MSDAQLFPTDPEVQTRGAEKNGARPVYPQWEALETLFGPPRTPSNQRLYGKIASELRQAGYGKADILLAARLYRGEYRGITFTATALLKHIDQLMYEAQKDTDRRSARTAPRLVVLPDLEAS